MVRPVGRVALMVWMFLVLVLAGAEVAAAQTSPQTPPQTPTAGGGAIPRLRVFLDCGDCYSEYLRDEIEWVDFVRQAQDADVHLLSNSTGTGGGGREIVLRFVGNGRFKGVDQDLKVLSVTADPDELQRRRVLRTVIVGLAYYLARDGRAGDLGVSVRMADMPVGAAGAAARDPWNKWFFSLRTEGSGEAEETSREWDVEFSASADRITDRWILSFGVNASESVEEFDLDEDEPLKARRHERGFDWFAAKSLGPHWSIGFTGGIEASSFGNQKFNLEAGPAIEYSIFPYSDYASRRFVIMYAVGAVRNRYNEITLFGKLQETLPVQELSIDLEQEQPWGSLEVGTEWRQYLHDRTKYRLEVNGELSFRVARGLELNADASASRIRDQLSIPRRDATPEEVLLRLRELLSGYEVSFSIGVTYSFGSIFNNIVNPRFGR